MITVTAEANTRLFAVRLMRRVAHRALGANGKRFLGRLRVRYVLLLLLTHEQYVVRIRTTDPILRGLLATSRVARVYSS